MPDHSLSVEQEFALESYMRAIPLMSREDLERTLADSIRLNMNYQQSIRRLVHERVTGEVCRIS